MRSKVAALLVDIHLDQIGAHAPRIRNEFITDLLEHISWYLGVGDYKKKKCITDLLEHISGYLGVGDSKEQKEEKKEEKKKGSFR